MNAAAEGIEQLARRLWGEPNRQHSTRDELRFGSQGSKSVKLKDSSWYDHEAGEGGGYSDLHFRVHGTRPTRTDANVAAAYDYDDASGNLAFQVVRLIPKTFRQRRPDGNGGWVWDMRGVERVPYRLPDLLRAAPHAPIFICEGEKDCDALRDRGLIATTNPGGAGKWLPSLSAYLRGRNVVILPDNDAPGEDHANDVVRKLRGIARTIVILRLPGLPAKGDASDWLAAGGTAEELEAQAAEALRIEAECQAKAPTSPEADATRIREFLNVYAWAELDIPPTVRLLGELVVPASRTFIVGTTGVGKTLIAYEIAAGMAAGDGFLHWTCDRPSRVLILDGEMPDALIKQRVKDIIGRHSIPAANLVIYSAGRAEATAKAVQLPPMPPLNTEAGHVWVRTLIDLLKPDVVIADNLMSLAPGNHAEPDTWLRVLPLVMEISSLNVAQIWCDHSGWDASRQYGTSTKAWTFDSVGIIKPPPEDQRQPDALTVNLTFESPGKARRRTPENRADFEPKTLILRDGVWSSDGATPSNSLSPTGMGWLRDITGIFSIDGVSESRMVSVLGLNCVRITISRGQLRDYLRKCGRIGDGTHANLTDADRTKLRGWLNTLREAGKIGIDGEYIWLA